MKKLNSVYVGVGTNLGDKLNNIQLAYKLIQSEIGEIVRKSHVYKTPPWGFESDEYFYNSVIEIKTFFDPEKLLNKLQSIERVLGKKQKFKIGYSSRLIDLDIIDFNNQIIDSKRLTIPHSHVSKRNFVLYPLKDVCPNWIHPITKRTIQELLNLINEDVMIEKVV